MTVHHYFKIWRSVNAENFKNFSRKFLQVQSPSAMMKLALMRTATVNEEPELPLLQRRSSLVTSLRICSPNKCFTEKDTHLNVNCSENTVWIHGRIAAKKPLLKDNNKKKRLAWAKKHEQWSFSPVEIRLLVWWVQIWDFWIQPLCLCETQSRWTDDLRMCGSHREAWRRRCDGVGVLCWWHSVIYLEFKAHLSSMATTAFCSDLPSHLVCA